jgi:hypothetical protein
MTGWDAKALGERFLSQAIDAERYAQEPRTEASKNEPYKRVYDQTLVASYIDRRLTDETFLSSRQALVRELKNMLAVEFQDSRAFDQEGLKKLYAENLRRLLKEFDVLERM